MPLVVGKIVSYQYTGTGGEALLAQFSNATFISEVDGVLTYDIEDAGTLRTVVQANGWVFSHVPGQVSAGSATDADYQAQYVEIS